MPQPPPQGSGAEQPSRFQHRPSGEVRRRLSGGAAQQIERLHVIPTSAVPSIQVSNHATAL